MGLRCLLGHDFDEPGIEREREEEGDEVVTTVREVKTCVRCGETQIVSENTEVTTIQQLTRAAAGDDDTASEEPEPEPSAVGDDSAKSEKTEPSATAVADRTDSHLDPEAGGAEIIDADPDDASPANDSVAADAPATAEDPVTVDAPTAVDGSEEAGGSDGDAELIDAGPDVPDDRSVAGPDGDDPETGSREGDAADAETDDGVILHDDDASADSPDRERGAWPEVDADEDSAAEPQPWPDQRGEDEGFSAEIDEGDDSDGGVEFGSGLTPEATADADVHVDGETEFIEAPAPDAVTDESRFDEDAVEGDNEGNEPVGSGITRADGPAYQVLADGTDSEYYCPECGMTRGADGNSMRAGDICPECKRGYVDERPA